MRAANARRFVLAAVVIAAIGGCGGGDDSAGEIETMLRAGFAAPAPAVLCEKTLSDALVKRLYGSRARCSAAETASAPARAPASSAAISRVTVDGDRGTAFVVVRGGDLDGTRGRVSVAREDGGWRLDDLSTAYLRSQLRAGAANDPSLSPALRDCLGASVDELGDASLRTLAVGAMSGQQAALQRISSIVRRCVVLLNEPPDGDAA